MALYAFDGTWQHGKSGDDPNIHNTNVFKFYEAYHKRSGTKDNDLYVPGIGTRFDFVGRILGGVFGLGELPRLLEAYNQLCKNWLKGDTDIDVIGFSRGAATTLDFCNLVQKKGIRNPDTEQVVEASPKIRFLGVWDIVAAFGLASLGNEVLNIGHHLQLPKENLQYCFHAMALDERRPSFLNTRLPGACEVWFRGVHSDIGGGNSNIALSDITLRWMMRKAKGAGLPIDEADIPKTPQGSLEPSHSNKLPLAIRLISAVDRRHYSVSPIKGWTTPPDTCATESDIDEGKAAEVGASGLQVQTEDMRRRVLVMWETAQAVAAANEFKIDPLREPLLTLFEGRSVLVTDDAKLAQAGDAVKRLMSTTIAGARERGFHELQEFFLNEALFKSPRLFPLTD